MSAEAPKPTLQYEPPDLRELTIRTEEGVLSILIPPAKLERFAWQMTAWSLGLAWVGGGIALRVLPMSLSSRVPRYIPILVGHAGFIPLPVLIILVAAAAAALARAVLARGRWTRIAVDDQGLVLDHPTAILRRPSIPMTRLKSVEVAQGISPALWINLRDGLPSRISFEARADASRAAAAINKAIATIRATPRFVQTNPVFDEQPLRLWSARAGWCGQKNWPSIEFRYCTHGLQVTITPRDDFLGLYILRAGAVCWLSFAVISFFHSLDVIIFLQWTMVYAVLCIGLYARSSRSARIRLARTHECVYLFDAEFLGPTSSWPAGQINSIRVAGPLWWILRVGQLRLCLSDGTHVTLLHGYPVTVLRQIARELGRDLRGEGGVAKIN